MARYPQKDQCVEKKNFLLLVKDLEKDYKINPESWKNSDVGSYLKALAEWVENIDSQNTKLPENLDWKLFANILSAASIYE